MTPAVSIDAGGRRAEPASAPRLALNAALTPVWNAALSHAGEPIALGGGASVVFERALAPEPERLTHRLALVDERGRGEGCEVFLTPDDFPFEAAFGAPIGLDDLGALPASLSRALHLGVRDAWLMAIERHCAVRPLETTEAGAVDSEGAAHWFAVRGEGIAAAPCTARVGVRPGALAAYLASSPSFEALGRGRLRFPELARRIALTARVAIASIPLAPRELRALAPGDLLVLSVGETGLPRRELVLPRCRIALAPAEEGGWSVLARRDGTAKTEDEDAAMADEHTAEPVAELSVTVDLDIGAVELPLADLETMTPGAVVPLELPDLEAARVTLRVNGRAVAIGTLVQIDDRLAVQIAETLL